MRFCSASLTACRKMRCCTTGRGGTSVYTLRSRLIQLQVELPNGGQRIVRLLRPGDVGGWKRW
jgi:hypothetical protein